MAAVVLSSRVCRERKSVKEAVEVRSGAERDWKSLLCPSKSPLLGSSFPATGLNTRPLVFAASQARFWTPEGHHLSLVYSSSSKTSSTSSVSGGQLMVSDLCVYIPTSEI